MPYLLSILQVGELNSQFLYTLIFLKSKLSSLIQAHLGDCDPGA